MVDTSYVPTSKPTLRINEILAQNLTTLTNGGTMPDLVELYNYGSGPIDLVGMTLSDTLTSSNKFIFPPGTPLLNAGQCLTLFADSQTAAPGIHLGFNLKAGGDDLYLNNKAANGGALLDSVVFGLQLPDCSIGRGPDGVWRLCRPTFGTGNIAIEMGDTYHLRINEWLADEMMLANNDFIELHNPDPLPVALGGCYLSDAEGSPALSQIPPLSFIAPGGYLKFIADSNPSQGADHLTFKLDPKVGIILLSDAALGMIDAINYGPQTTDVSQGRSPNGSDVLVQFVVPTPGAPNPNPNGIQSVTNVTKTIIPLLDIDHTWRYDNSGGTNLGTAWSQTSYPEEAAWPIGTNLFGYEVTPNVYPFPFRTYIPPPSTNGGKITVYYRTHFQWAGELTNYTLVSTNFVDDGSVYYLNGVRIGSLRMTNTVTYDTPATIQPSEGTPEILWFTNQLVLGDNVMAVEVHQTVGTSASSDDVFGMQMNAVQLTTNLIVSVTGIPVVLNEVFAANHSITNANGATSDWVELFNPTTNTLNLGDLSLSNDPNNPRKYVLAGGTTLAPNRHLMIYFDNDLPASTNSTGFSLDASSGTVLLFNSPTNGGGLIDGLNYGFQAADFSVGRVPNGAGAWTLTVPTEDGPNTAAGLGTVSVLRINEWLADPSSGSDWFELHNRGDLPVSISGLFFTDDLTKKTLSPVPPLSFAGTGANGFLKFAADNNPNAGANHVNFSLSKSGEQIGLFSPTGTLIDAIGFGSQVTGVSEGRFPDNSTNIVRFASTPSPEESNYLPLANIVVNEILAHTDPPLEDAVEFYNSSASPVNIGGWFLSNSQEDLKKYRIADGTLIPAYGFKVIYENQFNPTNGSSLPFTFNSAHGDRVYLSEADASGLLSGHRAPAIFGASANGVSFGRHTNSIGRVDLVPMSARSFGVDNPLTLEQFREGAGSPNPYPLVGPVVINEVMFYPPMLGIEDDTQNEYLELHNLSTSTVPLFDPLAPTNTWKIKGGIDFSFPQDVSIPAEGYLLLVNFDPEENPTALAGFRSRYGLSPSVPLFGPYRGNLANAGETIELDRPDPPQTAPKPDVGFVPYLLVEQLDYLNASPWPIGAGGTGSSLQRNAASDYGNDPNNWFIAAPTAGNGNNDTNGDGLPDAWQLLYWPSVNDPEAAPGADPDGDDFNNRQEYLAGTIPTNAASFLKIDSVEVSGPSRLIRFTAVAGKTYTVLYKNSLADANWQQVTNMSAQGSNGPVSVTDSAGAPPSRYYRLVTPQVSSKLGDANNDGLPDTWQLLYLAFRKRPTGRPGRGSGRR